MIDRGKFRTLLGSGSRELSNEQIDAVRDDFYSLGHMLLQWDKQHAEASSEKIPEGRMRTRGPTALMGKRGHPT